MATVVQWRLRQFVAGDKTAKRYVVGGHMKVVALLMKVPQTVNPIRFILFDGCSAVALR